MTLERARELIGQQIEFGSGCNRNAVRLILDEFHREHGQTQVDELIRQLEPNEAFGFTAGTDFSQAGR